MKLNQLSYQVNNKKFNLHVSIPHPKYGDVTCLAAVIENNNRKIRIKRVFVTGKVIPLEAHTELLSETKSNDSLMAFINEKVDEYIESQYSNENFNLSVKSVQILSSKTQYIRNVVRKGFDINDINETQTETHTLRLAVSFKEIEEIPIMTLKYKEQIGYTLSLKDESNKIISDYLSPNWKEQLKEQIIPIVKEEANFLLPN